MQAREHFVKLGDDVAARFDELVAKHADELHAAAQILVEEAMKLNRELVNFKRKADISTVENGKEFINLKKYKETL